MRLRWWLALSFALLAGSAFGQDCAAYLERAQAAFQTRSLPVAVREFEQALAVCADRVPILISLAQTQYLLGDEIPAEKHLVRAIELDRRGVAAPYALGRIYYQQKRYPEAVVQFARVVELDAGHYRGWDNLGLCYDALQQDSDALRAYFRALDLVKEKHPDYDWAYGNLADFFLRRNEFEKAFQFGAEAARKNPTAARNFFLTGKALSKLDKAELSLRWLEQAVQLDPEYTEALYLLAQTYRRLGQPERAAQTLAQFKEASKTPRSRR